MKNQKKIKKTAPNPERKENPINFEEISDPENSSQLYLRISKWPKNEILTAFKLNDGDNIIGNSKRACKLFTNLEGFESKHVKIALEEGAMKIQSLCFGSPIFFQGRRLTMNKKFDIAIGEEFLVAGYSGKILMAEDLNKILRLKEMKESQEIIQISTLYQCNNIEEEKNNTNNRELQKAIEENNENDLIKKPTNEIKIQCKGKSKSISKRKKNNKSKMVLNKEFKCDQDRHSNKIKEPDIVVKTEGILEEIPILETNYEKEVEIKQEMMDILINQTSKKIKKGSPKDSLKFESEEIKIKHSTTTIIKNNAPQLNVLISDKRLTLSDVVNLKKLGINIVEDKTQSFNIFATSSIKRSIRLLIAINRGAAIVSSNWLFNCLKSKSLQRLSQFSFNCSEMESEFSFSILESLKRARTIGFLSNYKFWIPKNVHPDFSSTELLIKTAGGEIIEDFDLDPTHANVFHLFDKQNENLKDCLKSRNVKCYATELLFSGCLRQSLEPEEFEI